jgi:DNA processing protein
MSGELPEAAYAAAITAVPSLGPARVTRLLDAWSPSEAWAALRANRARAIWAATEHRLVAEKSAVAVAAGVRRVEPERVWARCLASDVRVHLRGDTTYPQALLDDLDPPPVLFSKGDLGAIAGRRATVVGTRNPTAAGREVAFELGVELARAGVVVVSGLARGIDGCAHRGALDVTGGAPPVGVVASGLDVIYPREHGRLWTEVAERGVLFSEVPPGMAPHAFRFPLRNRVLAALGEVVVVVESRSRGGSLITAEEALRRDLQVLAVPGSPKNPAAEGANGLLIDGATPIVSAVDVLIALGFARPEDRRKPAPPLVEVDPADRWAVDLLGAEPVHLDAVVGRSGRPLLEVAATMARLELLGVVRREGSWFERAHRSTVPAP